jgi:hypothetical protein
MIERITIVWSIFKYSVHFSSSFGQEEERIEERAIDRLQKKNDRKQNSRLSAEVIFFSFWK